MLLTSFTRRSGAMRGAPALLALGLMIGAQIGAAAPAAAQSSRPDSFADLVDRLSPAVVDISTAQTVDQPNRPGPRLPEGSPFEDLFRDFFGQRGEGQQRVQSLGSGFVIDPAGFVVTNNHVIEGADEIEINFTDGTSLPAELIGRDPKTDLAVLKVESATPLPAVPWGDSEAARVGDWVLAIGNPLGFGGSVSAGIISARNRGINAGPYDDFIQTDAAINKGNSGGPLFNMDGEVIGVNTAIVSPTGGSIGIGFAVPSSLAVNVVAQLKDFGETRRGWLGVRIQEVDDSIAESLGMDRAMGALVAGVDEAGPAAAAGIEAGDVIVRFDGESIEEMRELPRVVAETAVGSTVEVEVLRDGDMRRIDVTIARLDEDAPRVINTGGGAPDGPSTTSLGMTLETLNGATRARFNISPDVRGVVVTEIDDASSAAERGVRPGDVIVEVAQQAVSTPTEARDRIEEAEKTGRRSVLLMLDRQGDLRFVAVDFEN